MVDRAQILKGLLDGCILKLFRRARHTVTKLQAT
jgi:hypothetical protein